MHPPERQLPACCEIKVNSRRPAMRDVRFLQTRYIAPDRSRIQFGWVVGVAGVLLSNSGDVGKGEELVR